MIKRHMACGRIWEVMDEDEKKQEEAYQIEKAQIEELVNEDYADIEDIYPSHPDDRGRI